MLCYGPGMASRVVRARLDRASERALELLLRGGKTESEIVRAALVDAGRRRTRRSALMSEAATVAADPADRAEIRRVREDMDSIGRPWPTD